MSDGASIEAQLVAHEGATGLVLLRTTGAGTVVPAPLDNTRVEPGSLAATAVQWLDRHIVAPVFVTAASEDSYAIDAHGAALSGMPLYNLDGQAFAIATGSAHGTAYPAREALERLTVRAASGRAIDAALGMTFQALTAPLVRVFHPTGALVTSVVPSGPAASAGIVHGDVVTAIGEMTVDSPEAAQKAIATLTPGAPTTVAVARGTRTLTMSATAGSAFALSSPALRPDDADDTSVSAGDILSVAEIESIGVAADAVVLEINAQPARRREEAAGEWRRARAPETLYLDQNGVRFFAVVDDRR